MIKIQPFRGIANLPIAFSLGLLMLCSSLFGAQQIALAAPPVRPALPVGDVSLTTAAISATKIALPAGPASPGQTLTYTIIFSADTGAGTVVVTDVVPELTTYQSGTITGTPPASLTVAYAPVDNLLTWTATNVLTDSVLTLTFAVTVAAGAEPGAVISNTAWISQSAATYTTTVAASPPVSQSTYLPVVLKNFLCSQDKYEPNDGRMTKAEAWPWDFGSGVTISGNFCTSYSDPADYFWLELTGGTLEIWLYPPATADYDIYIYKGENGPIQTPYGNTTGFGAAEHIVYNIPGPDVYFIRVHPYNKGASGDSYTLKVNHPNP